LVGPAITTAVSGEVICAVCADSDGVSTVSAPYTAETVSTNGHDAAYHITTTTVTSEHCTFNDSSTGGGCVSAAAFKPASAGAPTGVAAWAGSHTGLPTREPKEGVLI
jgi:hypothetical protein